MADWNRRFRKMQNLMYNDEMGKRGEWGGGGGGKVMVRIEGGVCDGENRVG